MNLQEILLSTIIGDTLGRPFISLSSGHIRSTIKKIDSYVDPEFTLKDKLEKWVKPGLYSSISQFIIIIGMSFRRKKFSREKFLKILASIPEMENRDSGIFRNTEKVENELFFTIKNNLSIDSASEISTSKIIPFVIPLSLSNKNDEMCIHNSIDIITLFTKDLSALSAGMILSVTIHSLLNNKNNSINRLVELAVESCEKIISIVNSKPENIFNLKINPESLLSFLNDYKNIFQGIQKLDTPKSVEEKICSFVNFNYKLSVKRSNLNIPVLLLPYTFFLVEHYSSEPSTILYNLLYKGGQTSIMLSIAGALIGCANNTNELPESLKNDLINRKKLYSILERIIIKDFPDNSINEFIESEKLLTTKEEQELKSKLKHYHKNKKKSKSKIDKKDELTKHVVESWTKIDKAKWKKQRKKIKNN